MGILNRLALFLWDGTKALTCTCMKGLMYILQWPRIRCRYEALLQLLWLTLRTVWLKTKLVTHNNNERPIRCATETYSIKSQKRYWDSSLEEYLNCHIHPPMFLSFSPLSFTPIPLQDTSLIQAKGLTLKQSLPLILAWLLRPPIASECAWYLSTGSSPLIKTDSDRRMWISSAIMCLLRIITVFSHSSENKRKLLRNS